MRRSKMVKYLYKLLKTYEDCEVSEAMAEEVLSGLESMGMMPPTITILPNSYNRAEGTHGYKVNRWED